MLLGHSEPHLLKIGGLYRIGVKIKSDSACKILSLCPPMLTTRSHMLLRILRFHINVPGLRGLISNFKQNQIKCGHIRQISNNK